MKTRFFSLLILNLLLTACGVNTPTQQPVQQPTQAVEVGAEVDAGAPTTTLPQPAQQVSEQDTAAEQSAEEVIVSAPVTTDSVCDTSAFIDIQADPANGQYEAPELNVYCEGDTMVIESNGIPNFEFVEITPRGLSTQDHHWEIPTNPQIAATTTEIPLLGTVAFAVNGLPIYGPNEAANLGWGDPILDEVLDFCNGHTGGQADYHYHGRPDCLFTDWEGNTSLIMGYSLDGFPILSPYICEDAACSSIKKVESSWQRTQDVVAAWDAHEYIAGSGDLDQCNGMILPDGSYAYFATDTFPYIQACYRGTPSIGGGNGGQPGGQAAQQGPRPDFAAAAAQLGVSEQALRDALGDPPPDFRAAAEQLDISEDALRDAIGPPPGR